VNNEQAVIRQIVRWADSREDVRAVILTGSRANPHPDSLSDYDIQVFVREIEPISRDERWIEPFGPIMVRWPLRPQSTSASPDWLTQLILFEDGIRIDFQFTIGKPPFLNEYDNNYVVLCDKDRLSESWSDCHDAQTQSAPPQRGISATD
jgi:aminoglycoside 6-adenylyltransferase